MTSNKQIRCPECDAIFKIDETNYSSIVNQVRDHLFEEQLTKRVDSAVDSAVKIKEEELKNFYLEVINKKNLKIKDFEKNEEFYTKDKNTALEKQKNSLTKYYKEIIASKEGTIKDFEHKEEIFEKDKKIAVNEAIDSYKLSLDEVTVEKNSLKTLLDYVRKEHAEEIKMYKENKKKLSTKMVGESLEESCLIDYDRYIRRILTSASFEKDHTSSTGTKGDYVFRDYDPDGNEIISIMFDMKNEEEDTIYKQTNKEHFKKLDKDRREKNCEYAVLVSNLEMDDERYNSGFTTVYHEYPKMIVVRPNCFVSTIYTLRELGLELLELKSNLEKEKSKTIDIKNFKESLEGLQLSSSKNLKLIFKNIDAIIKKLDRIIKDAEDSKEILLNSLTSNTKTLNKKLQGISIEKLIKNNPTMTYMFENLEKEVSIDVF